MRAYFAVFNIRTKSLFQYRTASLAGVFTQLFWGILQVMIFRAFYAQALLFQPISLEQAVTFIWIGQGLLQMLPWNLDKEIERQIKSGDIAYELIRPIHLYNLWFTRSLALRLIPTVMRCLPIFIIGVGFFGFESPVSWYAGGAFFLSVISALLLASSITTIMIISVFWTLSGEGIQRLLPHCAVLLSGMIVPLPLFPGWAQPFLNIQPFRGIIDIPCRFYTGLIPASETPYYLGFQIAWVIIFVILGRLLMNRALKQFVIQGG